MWDVHETFWTYTIGMRKCFHDDDITKVERWFPSKTADFHEDSIKGLFPKCESLWQYKL